MQKRRLVLAMALPLLMAGCAGVEGAPSYPQVVGNGESMMIDYGSGPMNNVVGGGAVALSGGAGENLTITHLDRSRAQKPPAGMAPTIIQQGENTEIVWIPVPSSVLVAR